MTLLRRLGRLRPLLPPLGAGLLTAAGQAPLGLWPLSFLGVALLARGHLATSGPRDAARRGWLFGLGYFAAWLAWIVEPFLVDIARHGWMAPFALVLMAGGLALFWGAALALARRVAPAGLPAVLALVGALTLAEALRGRVFTGFPWASLGHNLIDSPFLPLAALAGPHGLTLALLLPAGLLGLAMVARRRALPGALALLSFVLPLGLALGLPPRARPAGPEAPLLRLVQPNAAQRVKWDPEMIPVFFRRQLSYSAAARPDGRRPDLVIWPETSVPYLLDGGEDLPRILADAANGAAIAVGIQRREGARYYNSLALIDAGGRLTGRYDKHHLVPFGEYMPLGDQLARLGISALAARNGYGYSAGPGARLLTIDGVGQALPLICYEAVFPRDIRAAPARPDFLLQVTNDAWFGSFSGPYQHLAQARLRASEAGLPMVRVANTGVSALVSADGTVLSSLPLDSKGYLDVALPPPSAPTPYSRSGDLPALLAALALILVAGIRLFTRDSARAHKSS